MAISLASLKSTAAHAPPRILTHGVAGIGKSTFGAQSDHPAFVLTEDGLGMLKASRRPSGAHRIGLRRPMPSGP